MQVLYRSDGVTDGATNVPVDPDPNVTPPPSNRVLLFNPENECNSRYEKCSSTLAVFIADGTSVTISAWCKDERTGRWWKVAGTTLLATSGAFLFTPPSNALFFIQVTANTGNVKRLMVAGR
jgi:hypothetical protein